MPYFRWKGVTLHGTLQKGLFFAADERELDAHLLRQEIALLSFHLQPLLFKRKVSLSTKADYFGHLAMLLKAGMLVPQALQILAQQATPRSFLEYSYQIAAQVNQGISFSDTVAHIPGMNDRLIVSLLTVGQESGKLVTALTVITHYVQQRIQFNKQLRSVTLLPALTFAFFIVIVTILMVVILPQFEMLFAAMHKELPYATRCILAARAWLCSFYPLIVGMVGVIFAMSVRFLCARKNAKAFIQSILVRLPLVKFIIVTQSLARFFQALALLVEGGIPLTKAINVARASIANSTLQEKVASFEQDIQAGSSFADVCSYHTEWIGPDIVALLRVGQESGMLADVLHQIGDLYQKRLLQRLKLVSMLMQPFLLLILGILISCLIVALYAPIMSISASF